jgi:hypothetical protein
VPKQSTTRRSDCGLVVMRGPFTYRYANRLVTRLIGRFWHVGPIELCEEGTSPVAVRWNGGWIEVLVAVTAHGPAGVWRVSQSYLRKTFTAVDPWDVDTIRDAYIATATRCGIRMTQVRVTG